MEKEYYKSLADKYFAGTISETEISELAGWIRNDSRLAHWWKQEFEKSAADISPELRNRMFARIKAEVLKEPAGAAASAHVPASAPVSAPSERISERIPVGTSERTSAETTAPRLPKKRLLPAWTRWAAMICLPIFLAFFTYYLLNVSTSADARAPFIVKAEKGDKATVVLPDGTDVILNSASSLSYLGDFGKDERRVQLEGEGYFSVAHDARRSFIVQVGEVEVQVLGTVFDVSAYSDDRDVTVVLLEGKVGISTPSASLTMKPGEKMNYNKATGKLTTETVHADDYVSWTQGNLYFQNESLKNIMNALSRMYDVTIRIDSPRIADERFTGTIPGGGIQNALNIIMLTSPFHYVVEDSVIVLKEK